MMDEKELFEAIQALLSSQHFAVLATQGDEYPYCTLVGYVAGADARELFFATIRATRKYKNLQKNPNVSLMIDSQKNNVNDFEQAQALTVLGRAQEVKEAPRSEAMTAFLKRHPYLHDFVTSADCALIRVHVTKYVLVRNFQNVLEYSFV